MSRKRKSRDRKWICGAWSWGNWVKWGRLLMDTGYLFRAIKMLWNQVMVMVAQL